MSETQQQKDMNCKKCDQITGNYELEIINLKNKIYAKQCEIEDLLNENEDLLNENEEIKQRLSALELIYKDYNKA